MERTLKKKVGDILFYISATIFIGALFTIVVFLLSGILALFDYLTINL